MKLYTRTGDAGETSHGLGIFANGGVEMLTRISADFSTPFDVRRVPFDRPPAEIEAAAKDATTHDVVLEFDQDDYDFSRVADAADLPGWRFGQVQRPRPDVATLARAFTQGKHGFVHANVVCPHASQATPSRW